MSTAASLDEAYVMARRLEQRHEHVQAAEAYLVAADHAEELGEAGFARRARTSARRNLVVAWAQKRWQLIENEDVTIDLGQWSRNPKQEITRFQLRFRTLEGDRRVIVVAIDRRGRVSRVTR